MRFGWLSKYIPAAEQLKANRFLKPFARHLEHHSLWQFNRRSVAGGVAVGLFFGLLLPVLQILFAALAAIVLRVNLPVAAFATLVTNPFTFPAVYYAAYRIGRFLTGGGLQSEPEIEAEAQTEVAQALATQAAEITSWGSRLVDWLQSVGLPLIAGLSVLAVAGAVLGYFLVDQFWKLRSRRRWNLRARFRQSLADPAASGKQDGSSPPPA